MALPKRAEKCVSSRGKQLPKVHVQVYENGYQVSGNIAFQVTMFNLN